MARLSFDVKVAIRTLARTPFVSGLAILAFAREHLRQRRRCRDCRYANGIPAAIGRWYTDKEDQPGGPMVVVLAYPFWKQRFGGDAGIVGQSITFDGAASIR